MEFRSTGLSITGRTDSDPKGIMGRQHHWRWAGQGGSGVGAVLGQGLIRSLLSHLQPRPSPCNDDEKVKPVPSVSQVTFFPEDAQGHHLHHHLHSEEGKDEVIKGLMWGGEAFETERRGGGTPPHFLPHQQGSGLLTETS